MLANAKAQPALKGNVDKIKLANFIKKWQKTRFKFGGDSRKGIDSTSLVIRSLKDQAPGANLPHSPGLLSKTGLQIASKALLPGDLLFFSTSKRRSVITHVGIYLGNGSFAYVNSSEGVTTQSLSGMFQKRLVVARRVIHQSEN